MDRVLLFDTSSLFFRAFHALPAMETRQGQPTSAVYGISVQLLQLLREQKPRGLAFALDGPQHQTFRRAQYADYKSHRPVMPDAFRSQWQLLDRWLEALGVPCFSAPGYEADDVLATLSRQIATRGSWVRLITGDRDLFQAAGPDVDVYFIGRRGQKPIIYDMDAIQTRFGVRIEQLPSLIALTGDAADNLPGLPGIGLKTATKLIQSHESISQLLSHLAQIDSASQRQLLSDASAQLLQNESLARLRFDAPLVDGPLYARPTRDAFARLRALFVELEFTSLLVRLERLVDANSD